MERPAGKADTSPEPALQQTSAEIQLDFFPLLCLHTRQGFYADPIYGGNKNRVGWEVIGFPGPTSLAEVHTGRYSALPWFAEGHNQPLEETEDGA
ncbi:MAG: gluconate 2-dehydrogenase subunit 3 family protein [Anaerolineae bacterium]|nr:gluconate 2-dehydrogenase subunit 3 family protein [Anaerolineae bacterium]